MTYIYIQKSAPIKKENKPSKTDSLAKDAKGNPDYSYFGKNHGRLLKDNNQILRHGMGGKAHINEMGDISYEKPKEGFKPKDIIDEEGRPVKLPDDRHGFLKTFTDAAKRGRIRIPMHVVVKMAEAANEAAERHTSDYHRVASNGKDENEVKEGRGKVFSEPFMAAMQAAEDFLPGETLRTLMERASADWRDGKSHHLSDGMHSPIALPLAAVARHHLTSEEKRDGKTHQDILTDDRDKKYHGLLKEFHENVQSGNSEGVKSHLEKLKVAGKHHMDALDANKRRTEEEDAAKPPEANIQRAMEEGSRVEAEDDAKVPPMSDDDLTTLGKVIEKLHANPKAYSETDNVPMGTKRTNIVDALAHAYESARSKIEAERPTMEQVVVQAFGHGLKPRENMHIQNGIRDGGPKAWHIMAHRDMNNDRHGIAKNIVDNSDGGDSLIQELGLDPMRIARLLTTGLPDAETMGKELTEKGIVPKSIPDNTKVVKGYGAPIALDANFLTKALAGRKPGAVYNPLSSSTHPSVALPKLQSNLTLPNAQNYSALMDKHAMMTQHVAANEPEHPMAAKMPGHLARRAIWADHAAQIVHHLQRGDTATAQKIAQTPPDTRNVPDINDPLIQGHLLGAQQRYTDRGEDFVQQRQGASQQAEQRAQELANAPVDHDKEMTRLRNQHVKEQIGNGLDYEGAHRFANDRVNEYREQNDLEPEEFGSYQGRANDNAKRYGKEEPFPNYKAPEIDVPDYDPYDVHEHHWNKGVGYPYTLPPQFKQFGEMGEMPDAQTTADKMDLPDIYEGKRIGGKLSDVPKTGKKAMRAAQIMEQRRTAFEQNAPDNLKDPQNPADFEQRNAALLGRADLNGAFPQQLQDWRNNPESLKQFFAGMTPEQVEAARKTQEHSNKMEALAKDGNISRQQMMGHFLWGKFTQQATPFNTEAAFIQALHHPEFNDLMNRSSEGKFGINEAKRVRDLINSGELFPKDAVSAGYTTSKDAKKKKNANSNPAYEVVPITKKWDEKNDRPGQGSLEDWLMDWGHKEHDDPDNPGQKVNKWDLMHRWINTPKMSALDTAHKFWEHGLGGSGIDNKILGLTMDVLGKQDMGPVMDSINAERLHAPTIDKIYQHYSGKVPISTIRNKILRSYEGPHGLAAYSSTSNMMQKILDEQHEGLMNDSRLKDKNLPIRKDSPASLNHAFWLNFDNRATHHGLLDHLYDIGRSGVEGDVGAPKPNPLPGENYVRDASANINRMAQKQTDEARTKIKGSAPGEYVENTNNQRSFIVGNRPREEALKYVSRISPKGDRGFDSFLSRFAGKQEGDESAPQEGMDSLYGLARQHGLSPSFSNTPNNLHIALAPDDENVDPETFDRSLRGFHQAFAKQYGDDFGHHTISADPNDRTGLRTYAPSLKTMAPEESRARIRSAEKAIQQTIPHAHLVTDGAGNVHIFSQHRGNEEPIEDHLHNPSMKNHIAEILQENGIRLGDANGENKNLDEVYWKGKNYDEKRTNESDEPLYRGWYHYTQRRNENKVTENNRGRSEAPTPNGTGFAYIYSSQRRRAERNNFRHINLEEGSSIW